MTKAAFFRPVEICMNFPWDVIWHWAKCRHIATNWRTAAHHLPTSFCGWLSHSSGAYLLFNAACLWFHKSKYQTPGVKQPICDQVRNPALCITFYITLIKTSSIPRLTKIGRPNYPMSDFKSQYRCPKSHCRKIKLSTAVHVRLNVLHTLVTASRMNNEC